MRHRQVTMGQRGNETPMFPTHPESCNPLTNSRERQRRSPLVSYIPHMNESVYWTASQQIWVKPMPVEITNYSSMWAKCLCLNQISTWLPWQYLHTLIALKSGHKTFWKCFYEPKRNKTNTAFKAFKYSQKWHRGPCWLNWGSTQQHQLRIYYDGAFCEEYLKNHQDS